MCSDNGIQKYSKEMRVFVVPGNSQALLGMLDTAAPNIINLNIDAIQAEITECKTNIKQEMHNALKNCANTDTDVTTKQDANGQNGQNNTSKSINYFFSLADIDGDKRKSGAMLQKIHDTFGDIFNGIGYFEGIFSLQLKPNSKPY